MSGRKQRAWVWVGVVWATTVWGCVKEEPGPDPSAIPQIPPGRGAPGAPQDPMTAPPADPNNAAS